MYPRQWKNNKLFAVFNDATTPIKLNPGETITSIQCTDGYFIESGDCTNNFTIVDVSGVKQLTLKSTVVIPTDTTNGQVKGVGYIITTAGGSSLDTTKPTGYVSINNNAISTDSANVTLNLSATDNIGVTGYYASENSTISTASQTGWTAVTSATSYSANPMFTLSSNDGTKTVYVWYKDVAGNVSTAYNDSITLAKNDGWKNWYGIAWRDTPANHMKYAKQIGYDYIGIANWRTPSQYRNDANAANLNFYFVEPWSLTNLFGGIVPGATPRKVDESYGYTAAQQTWYEDHMVWKSYSPFPQNMAPSVMNSATVYTVMWDFQQQVVIDKVVEGIIAEAKSFDDPSIPFSFAGYMIDEPKLNGQFFRWDSALGRPRQTTLTYWTGVNSGLLHGAITHEYATYDEGMAAFYKQLNTRMRQEFPDAKWIVNPWRLYSTASDEFIYKVKTRADKDQFTPDMLTQEGYGTEFVADSNIFNSGMNITKDMVGSSQPGKSTEYENRLYAAKAGINGAWYNWFGLFSEGDNTVNFSSITQVYPRLKLVKSIPNWDNLNNIPLANRSWDGNVYQSTQNGQPQSYISSDVMYSRQWKNGKLFVVFNTI